MYNSLIRNIEESANKCVDFIEQHILATFLAVAFTCGFITPLAQQGSITEALIYGFATTIALPIAMVPVLVWCSYTWNEKLDGPRPN